MKSLSVAIQIVPADEGAIEQNFPVIFWKTRMVFKKINQLKDMDHPNGKRNFLHFLYFFLNLLIRHFSS